MPESVFVTEEGRSPSMYPSLAKDQCLTFGSSQSKTMDLPALRVSFSTVPTSSLPGLCWIGTVYKLPLNRRVKLMTELCLWRFQDNQKSDSYKCNVKQCLQETLLPWTILTGEFVSAATENRSQQGDRGSNDLQMQPLSTR